PFFARFILLATATFLFTGCASSPRPTVRAGTLYQVGLVWLKNPGSAEDRQKIIAAVHAFGKEIPEVKSAVVGQTDGIGGAFSDTGYDVCFIISFENEAARLRYNAHPVHQKAGGEVFLPLSRKLLFYRFASE
ncbi:MAG: Dabb family protein, partial [Verrucomicrobiaceae bacterium]